MTDQKIETKQTREYLITSADVDFEGKIRMSALVNFMIQSAWHHAEHLGWGVNELHANNMVWVLSGIKVELSSYPEWKEKITVETWPKGLNRLFYLRDFLIYNEKNEIIGKATSNWLMIDIDKRRPKKHLLSNLDEITSNDKHAIQDYIPSLKFDGETDRITEFEIRYSNIDINQHLTTTGYIDFVFDTFTPKFMSRNRPKSITANFLHEVRFGTKVKMLTKTMSADKKTFQLEPVEGGKPFFRGELEF